MASRAIGKPKATGSAPQGGGNVSPSAAKVQRGYFLAWSPSASGFQTVCLMGGRAPVPVRGYGGWASSGVQGRLARSSYPGKDTPAMQITLMPEAQTTNYHAEEAVEAIERLAGWPFPGQSSKPPPFYWVANCAHDASDDPRLWVVESLEWDDLIYDDVGRLLRAPGTMVIAHYRPSSLPDLAVATGFRQVTLRAGETLRAFAGRVLDDKKRWKDIATLNRNNPRCPSGPEFKVTKDVVLSVPPKDS